MVANPVRRARVARRWHICLKTFGMGLGLLRLQLEAGSSEEAKANAGFLQADLQLLLHAMEADAATADKGDEANW